MGLLGAPALLLPGQFRFFKVGVTSGKNNFPHLPVRRKGPREQNDSKWETKVIAYDKRVGGWAIFTIHEATTNGCGESQARRA